VNWSKKYGDLRIAHFLGMHALQVIPLLSFYVVKNVNMVFVLALAYGIITLAVFIQALRGKSLFQRKEVMGKR
jgi:NO-binding membrane sensor protein with MHYT domain